MSGQPLSQQVVQDYLHKYNVLPTIEEALNKAIDSDVQTPEIFIADYILKNCTSPGPFIHNISLIGDSIVYTMNMSGNLQMFQQAAGQDLLRSLNLPKAAAAVPPPKGGKGTAVEVLENPNKVPIFVLEHLNNLNINQDFKELYEAVKNQFVLHQIMLILQSYFRESEFQCLSRLLRINKQSFSIPRAVIPIVQIAGKATINCVLRRGREAFQLLEQLNQQLNLKQFPAQIIQNEKTGEVACEQFKKFVFPDYQFKSYHRLLRPDEEPPKAEVVIDPKTKKPVPPPKKEEKPKLNFNQILLSAIINVAKLVDINNYQIIVQLNAPEIANDLSSGDLQLQEFLLNLFCEVRHDLMVSFSGIGQLPVDKRAKSRTNQRAGSATKKPAKGKEPVVTEPEAFAYSKLDLMQDVRTAQEQFGQLREFDKLLYNAAEPQKLGCFFDEQTEFPLLISQQLPKFCVAEDQTQFYQSLAEFKDDRVKFASVSGSINRAPSAGGAKSKAAAAQQVEGKSKVYFKRFLPLLWVQTEFVQLQSEQDVFDYIAEFWPMVQMKRLGF